jgi:alpha-glucosidase
VHRFPGQRRGRDPERTPMQWSAGRGAGFTRDGVEPWLPFGDLSRNVEAQRADAGSTLSLCRDLIALRRRRPDLHAGAYRSLPGPDGVWAFRRGDATCVALNLSEQAVSVGGLDGAVLVGTDRDRDGFRVRGTLELEPWEGVVTG